MLLLLVFLFLILLSCTLVYAGRTQTTSVHPGINKFRLSSGPLVLWSSGPLVLWSSGPLVLWSSSGFRSPGSVRRLRGPSTERVCVEGELHLKHTGSTLDLQVL